MGRKAAAKSKIVGSSVPAAPGGLFMENPYNVFISWSGATSKAVATALRDWLPLVINAAKPWMSSEDIEKGVRWFSNMTGQLKDIRIGILCLTPDNLGAPWILFEAGALSKTVEDAFVCPYLFNLESADLKGPLTHFQATKADKEETRKLLHTVNRALQNATLSDSQLDTAFNKWWEDLDKLLKAVPAPAQTHRPTRPEREMVEEILGLVRDLARQQRESLVLRSVGRVLGSPPVFAESSPGFEAWEPAIARYREVLGEPLAPASPPQEAAAAPTPSPAAVLPVAARILGTRRRPRLPSLLRKPRIPKTTPKPPEPKT